MLGAHLNKFALVEAGTFLADEAETNVKCCYDGHDTGLANLNSLSLMYYKN